MCVCVYRALPPEAGSVSCSAESPVGGGGDLRERGRSVDQRGVSLRAPGMPGFL